MLAFSANIWLKFESHDESIISRVRFRAKFFRMLETPENIIDTPILAMNEWDLKLKSNTIYISTKNEIHSYKSNKTHLRCT